MKNTPPRKVRDYTRIGKEHTMPHDKPHNPHTASRITYTYKNWLGLTKTGLNLLSKAIDNSNKLRDNHVHTRACSLIL